MQNPPTLEGTAGLKANQRGREPSWGKVRKAIMLYRLDSQIASVIFKAALSC
jgi:hypothetical protein